MTYFLITFYEMHVYPLLASGQIKQVQTSASVKMVLNVNFLKAPKWPYSKKQL